MELSWSHKVVKKVKQKKNTETAKKPSETEKDLKLKIPTNTHLTNISEIFIFF